MTKKQACVREAFGETSRACARTAKQGGFRDCVAESFPGRAKSECAGPKRGTRTKDQLTQTVRNAGLKLTPKMLQAIEDVASDGGKPGNALSYMKSQVAEKDFFAHAIKPADLPYVFNYFTSANGGFLKADERDALGTLIVKKQPELAKAMRAALVDARDIDAHAKALARTERKSLQDDFYGRDR